MCLTRLARRPYSLFLGCVYVHAFVFIPGPVVGQHKTFLAGNGSITSPIHHMVISPNGELVALATGRQSIRPFGPDKKRIVFEDIIVVFDLKKEKTVAVFEGKADGLTFSKDGKQVISYYRIRNALGKREDEISTLVTFWGIESGKCEDGNEINGRAFGITNRLVLTQCYPGYKYVMATDMESGKVVTLEGELNYSIRSGTVSPDGKYFVTIPYQGPTTVWDASTGKSLFAIDKFISGHATFFPDHKIVALEWAFYELPTGKELQTVKNPPLAVSSDTQLMACRGMGVFADPKNNDQPCFLKEGIHVYAREKERIVVSFEKGCRHLLFTPDGRYLVGGCAAGVIHVWDLSKTNSGAPK
jgi:WD40 repeat protein